MTYLQNTKTQQVGVLEGEGTRPATYIVRTVDGLAEWPAVDCVPC